MEKQNVTLSIPKDVLRKAKKVAIDQDTSLSGLMTRALVEIVDQEERYASAKRHHLAWLAQSADLGTDGRVRWSRDELHDR